MQHQPVKLQKSFLFGNAVNRSKVPGERDADALIIRCGVESLSPENLERINKFGLRPEPPREHENRHWVWTVRKWVSFCIWREGWAFLLWYGIWFPDTYGVACPFNSI